MDIPMENWGIDLCPAQQQIRYTNHFKPLAKGRALMKKKVFVLAIAAICLSVAAYGTLAYFTHEDTATNVITAGDIRIDLEEWAISEDGSRVPFEDIDDVMPGMEVSKIVQVTNTGGQEAWVRIAIEKTIVLAEGVEGEIDLSLMTYDLNTEYWTEKDGYFYYNTSLKQNETTEPLFTKVFFSTAMSNLYQHSKAIIHADAQATQAANNGNTVFDAAGWPTAE